MTRISARLITAMTSISLLIPVAAAASDTARVWISFKPGQKATVMQAVLASGGTIHYENDRIQALAAEVPIGEVDALAALQAVAYVEEEAVYVLDSDETTWGIEAVRAPQVWDVDGDGTFDPGAPRGAGRVVCIIDTGVAVGHPDLQGVDVLGGESFVSDGPWYEDNHGHGTFIAGIIAAQLNGVGTVGVAPDVSLYVVRASGDEAALQESVIMRGFDSCVAAGSNVINASFGGPLATRTADAYFNDLLTREDVLVVAAAGNGGNSDFHYPASYDGVVSVGSVDSQLERSRFSQFNATVELTAPGEDVVSAFPRTEQRTLQVEGEPLVWGSSAWSNAGHAVVQGRLEWAGRCDRWGNFGGAIVICNSGSDLFETHDRITRMVESGAAAVLVVPVLNETNEYVLKADITVPYSVPVMGIRAKQAVDLVHHKLSRKVTVDTSVSGTPSYIPWNGTSFSTPHVVAVAALIWSAYPEKSAEEVRAAMTATALDLGAPGRDLFFGYGLVQADLALLELASQ